MIKTLLIALLASIGLRFVLDYFNIDQYMQGWFCCTLYYTINITSKWWRNSHSQ